MWESHLVIDSVVDEVHLLKDVQRLTKIFKVDSIGYEIYGLWLAYKEVSETIRRFVAHS